MSLKKIFTCVSFLIISLGFAGNLYSMAPDVFVQSTVNRASQALNDNITKEKKIEALKNIAKETVDINGIGLYTLGSYRKNISDKQKKEYSILFEQYFLKTFASRLAEYSNPEIEVKSKEILNKNYTMVSSVLIATEQRPEVNINWRIYTKNPKKPLIRDLTIEGLSLARTQKAEFSSIIESNDGNIEVLFQNLRDFIN